MVAVDEAENVALARAEAAIASGVKAIEKARLRHRVRVLDMQLPPPIPAPKQIGITAIISAFEWPELTCLRKTSTKSYARLHFGRSQENSGFSVDFGLDCAMERLLLW
jgi:hypothetical protein